MRFPLQFLFLPFHIFTILRADKVLTLATKLRMGNENQQSYIVVMHTLIYHNLRHSRWSQLRKFLKDFGHIPERVLIM